VAGIFPLLKTSPAASPWRHWYHGLVWHGDNTPLLTPRHKHISNAHLYNLLSPPLSLATYFIWLSFAGGTNMAAWLVV